jgi:hypothetical protein
MKTFFYQSSFQMEKSNFENWKMYKLLLKIQIQK